MSVAFQTREFIVFVPKNHSISAEELSTKISRTYTIPKQVDVDGQTVGVVVVHFFEYESIYDLIKKITSKQVLVIVSSKMFGYVEDNHSHHLEYLEELKKLFISAPYRVLSISKMHKKASTSPIILRGTTLRGLAGSELIVINGSIPAWFNAEPLSYWFIPPGCGSYIATTCVKIEQSI